MFKKNHINTYLTIPLEEIFRNLTPEFRGHLRVVFNIKDSDFDKISLHRVTDDNSIVVHFEGEI